MPSHRTIIVALAAGAIALCCGEATSARTKPAAEKPCSLPSSGFHSCLRIHYTPSADGSVRAVRATATLLRRVAACPSGGPASRRVVITRDGARLDSARRPGHCRGGIVTWRTTFSPGETAGWALAQGDTVVANWRGVPNNASVTLSG